MDLYRLGVYVHLILAIFLMGMALFWLIMLVALRQRFSAEDVGQWLMATRDARWPHVVVPYRLRLPLPWISWGLIAALAITGVAIGRLNGAPSGMEWTAKMVLVAGIVALQVPMSRRPAAPYIHLGFWITLVTIIVSGIGVRG